jgi:uncharacterized protein (DUF305 family)
VVIDSPSGRRQPRADAAAARSTGGPDGPDLPDEPDEPGDDGPDGPDGPDGHGSAGHDRTAMRVVRIAVAVVAVPLVVAIAFLAGRVTASDAAPTDVSADAGFARDMQVHHAQAVEMSLIVRDSSTDPAIRLLAYDVLRTQQQQAGQMYAWLELWHLPQASNQAPMAWAAGMSHDSGTASGGATAMPGMAAAADLTRLGQLRGRAADRLYLQLMIAHHRGGVQMAEAAVRLAHRPEVVSLAGKIVTGQQSEITLMDGMLAQRP